MSKIVDTEIGRFRQVADGQHKWFLFECPDCGEWLPMNEDVLAGRDRVVHESQKFPASYCSYGDAREFGSALIAAMQAKVLMGYKPYHDEGEDRWQFMGGAEL
jgi:hypothetical protein